jgi:hypothetical protein
MNFIYKNGVRVDDYNKLGAAVGWSTLNNERAQAGIERSRMAVSRLKRDGKLKLY